MSPHQTSKNKKCEFESHKKLVGDIRCAVADHKKTQHLVDFFMIGMFFVVLVYTVVR